MKETQHVETEWGVRCSDGRVWGGLDWERANRKQEAMTQAARVLGQDLTFVRIRREVLVKTVVTRQTRPWEVFG